MRGANPETDTYSALVISDIHMRNDWPYSSVTSERHRTDRFIDQLNVWKHVAKEATERRVNAVIVDGDLFDRPLVDPVTMAGTAEALLSIPVPTYVIPGNHDEHRTGSFQTEVFGEFKGSKIRLLEHGEPLSVRDWLTFFGFHYRKTGIEADLARVTAGYEFDLNSQIVGLIHQSIKGCSHLGWVCDDGLDPKALDNFTYVLSGHFHDHQFFLDDQRGFYLGAPMQHHFGDVGRSSQYWHVTWRKGKAWKCEAIDPGAPTFHLMNWDEEFSRSDLKAGDFLRIDVHRTAREFEEIRESVEEALASFTKANVRAHVKFHPIYHHGTRLAKGKGEREVFTIDDMVEPYVKSPSVSAEGLDIDRIVNLGRRFLERARSA